MHDWLTERRQGAIEHLRTATALECVEWFTEIDSTNLHARRLLSDGGLTPPALLVADRQTAGRGRSDRAWWSPDGCLMFSLVIDTDWMPPDASTWTQLSLVAGVAAAKAADSLLQATTPAQAVQLKWPNDLYVAGRKLAGILVEATPLTQHSQHTRRASITAAPRMAFVIGIGMNVHVDWNQAPADVRDRGCSLAPLARRELHLEDVLVRIIEQLFDELTLWRSGDDAWWHAWNERNLLSGRTVHLRLPGDVKLIGQCEGIDLTGRLLVRDMLGSHEIQSADVLGWN